MPDTRAATARCLIAASAELRDALRQIEAALCAIIDDGADGTISFMCRGARGSVDQADGYLRMVANDE